MHVNFKNPSIKLRIMSEHKGEKYDETKDGNTGNFKNMYNIFLLNLKEVYSKCHKKL